MELFIGDGEMRGRAIKLISLAMALVVVDLVVAGFLQLYVVNPQVVVASPGTVTLTPNGAGFYTEFETISGAATHWEAVATDDGDISYIQSDVTGERDTFALTDSGLSAGTTINSVTVYVRARYESAADDDFYIMVRSGTTNDVSPLKNSDKNYGVFSYQLTADPNTGGAWTVAAIDALQAGAQIDTGVTITYIWVEVDYVSAVSISVSPVSYDFGIVGEGETKATGLTYFTLSNDGEVTVDTTIAGESLSGTGATDWALGAAAGANTYALKAGTTAYDITVTTTSTDFVMGLAASGTQDFGLQFTAPTSMTDKKDVKTGYVTITAVEAP